MVKVSPENPWCPHGPTVLFEKKAKSGSSKAEFYACSAFRDRKQCSFFLKKDDAVKKTENPELKKNPEYRKIKAFCKTCQEPIKQGHEGHDVINATEGLQRPSTFLKALDQAKGQAQFHFSNEALQVLVDTILGQNPDLVLCIGTPSIFEEVLLRKKSALLLDIDDRLAGFFGKNQFCHYNMFNHHFFDAQSKSNFEMKMSQSENIVVVTDPPFGGRPELIGKTLQIIQNEKKNCLILWIFPYFMEPQIQKVLPDLQMCDYQVTYSEMAKNYKQGQEKSKRKQGSPVRIFTNLPLNAINLKELTDYRYCQSCQKFVVSANRHCHECGFCTSKNGGLYRHCHECKRCVKSSWRHCRNCNRCALQEHPCQLFKSKSV